MTAIPQELFLGDEEAVVDGTEERHLQPGEFTRQDSLVRTYRDHLGAVGGVVGAGELGGEEERDGDEAVRRGRLDEEPRLARGAAADEPRQVNGRQDEDDALAV